MPLLFVVLLQGLFNGGECLYPVTVDAGDWGKGMEVYGVDLGWASYRNLKEVAESKYQVIGNIQIFRGQKDAAAPAQGAFQPAIKVTVPYPPEDPPSDPMKKWGLHFWAKKDKRWVSLETKAGNGELNPELPKYGIGILALERNQLKRTLTVFVTKWPPDDIIIGWDD